MKVVIPVLALFGLGACTSLPSPIEVTASPVGEPLPVAGGYVLDVSDTALPAEAMTAAERALEQRGWRRSTTPDAYRFVLSYTVRGEGIGAHTGRDAPADSSSWLVVPTTRPWWRDAHQVHEVVIETWSPQGLRISRAEARQMTETDMVPETVRLVEGAVQTALSGGHAIEGAP